MKYIYFLSAITENTVRSLQRITGIFARHRLDILQLSMFETKNKRTSCFNIVVYSEAETMKRVIKQLRRIIELMEVEINNEMPLKETPKSEFHST